MVFCGIYPISTNDYPKLTVALEKFQLNDSSIVYEKETSAALGHGYRLGFLGMLHMDITLETAEAGIRAGPDRHHAFGDL